MAEGARLESVFTRKGNVGSNPTLSAITFRAVRFRTLPSLRNKRDRLGHPSAVGKAISGIEESLSTNLTRLLSSC